MNFNKRDLLRAAAALPLAAGLTRAFAQDKFPSGPIKLIVPFAPGGANDIVGRILAEKMAPTIGQAIVVENKSGVGGVVGARAAARASADGHTLLLHSSTLIIQQYLTANPGYNYQADFTPISLLTQFPLVLVITRSLPASNITEFLEYARAKGSELFYGSAGQGSSQHLVGELFNRVAGTKIQHVPYRGNGPATAALLAGEIQVFFDIVPTAITLGAADKVKNLAVTSKTRSSSIPDLPTLHETILPGFEANFWQALFLPKGASPEIVKQWLPAVKTALSDKEVQARLHKLGFETFGSSPEELAKYMREESAKWGKVIADANIKV